MRAVVQRVASASVAVLDGDTSRETGRIGPGLLVLLGVETGDGPADVQYIASKIRELRIFPDRRRPHEPLGRRRRGRRAGRVAVHAGGRLPERAAGRPSTRQPRPNVARPLYEHVVSDLRASGLTLATGEFQAKMHVALVNDGPVTLLLDSRKRF